MHCCGVISTPCCLYDLLCDSIDREGKLTRVHSNGPLAGLASLILGKLKVVDIIKVL